MMNSTSVYLISVMMKFAVPIPLSSGMWKTLLGAQDIASLRRFW